MTAHAKLQSPRFVFDLHDQVDIRGVALRPIYQNSEGWAFARASGEGLSQFFLHQDIAAMAAAGEIKHVRGAFSTAGSIRLASGATDPLSLLDHPFRSESLALRFAFVDAFRALERQGRVKRTYASIEASMGEITREAAVLFRRTADESHFEKRAGRSTVVPDAPSAKSLLRWLKLETSGGLAGLQDQRCRSGNRTTRRLQEETALLMAEVRRFASIEKPTVMAIHRKVRARFEEANRARTDQGLVPLRVPSYESVRLAIRKFTPFAVALYRDGVEAARKTHAPVGEGVTTTRPLERVEMDEWKIDLITILTDAGLYEHLTAAEKEEIGFDKLKGRLWLSVAICTTTKCILALRLARSPGTASAVETLHMALVDKGQWADGVQARSPWCMYGMPELIVTDGGPGFKSHGFRTAASDLGITAQRAAAGLPRLRANIERTFRTMGLVLMPMLAGRTFSDIVTKGDQDPADRAALTVEDFTFAVVRWVVDIYHNTPHEGLDYETPLACWQRLAVTDGGVRPPPDMRLRRLVFGTRAERTVHPHGIEVMGLTYQNRALQDWRLKAREKTVVVRVYPHDLGSIMVCLDGVWFEVPCLQHIAKGLTARTWVAAVAQLRTIRNRDAALSEPIVLQAIRDIEARTSAAQERAHIVVDEWSDVRIAREEERLFMGFTLPRDVDQPENPDDGLGSVLFTPPVPQAGDTPPPPDGGPTPPRWTIED